LAHSWPHAGPYFGDLSAFDQRYFKTGRHDRLPQNCSIPVNDTAGNAAKLSETLVQLSGIGGTAYF